jgi:hypothetical protein
MGELPDDFAEALARVVEPADQEAVASVIEAATLLGDDGLRRFLELFGARILASGAPVRYRELRAFLRRAQRGAGAL